MQAEAGYASGQVEKLKLAMADTPGAAGEDAWLSHRIGQIQVMCRQGGLLGADVSQSRLGKGKLEPFPIIRVAASLIPFLYVVWILQLKTRFCL